MNLLTEQHKLGIPMSSLKRQQVNIEEKRENALMRRNQVQVEKEKLKYWHLIKRDVIKHRKEIATQEVLERIKHSRCLTKWVQMV